MAKDYGNWVIKERLGEGGQAHVFLVTGRPENPDKRYVLKRLKSRRRAGRFEDELRAGLALSHPNIMKVIDHDLDAEKPYIVTEYYEGGSLSQFCPQLPRLTTIQKLCLFLNICKGVACAHQNQPKIIHRDLKPDNIFLDKDCTNPVVGDFGLCFIDGDTRHTETFEQVGSRFYMAPESADGLLENVDPRLDVYSLGKILYWMLSNGKIFDREKHRESRYDISKDKIDSEFFILNDFLDKMIVEDRGRRLNDAAEVMEKVKDIILIVQRRGHYINIDAPQVCLFCAAGTYKIHIDGVSGNKRKHLSTNIHNEIRNNFGVEPVSPQQIIMVCSHCGNVQTFRTDLATTMPSPWKKAPNGST